VAHACNPSYSGGRLEDRSSKPAWANSSQEPTSKNTQHKKTKAGGVPQVVEHLPSKCEARSSNPSIGKKKEKESKKNEHSEKKQACVYASTRNIK
jgi:hypothetical protein